MEVRTGRPVNEQPPGFTKHTDRFIVDDDDMDPNTVLESDMSLKIQIILAQGEWSSAKDAGPILVSIPLWVAWWVSVYNRSPCSMMLLSPRAQRYLTFMSGFPPGFLMQLKVAHQESVRCIARPNSSSASILLWLFLHLNLFAFFSTSIWDHW